MSTSSSSRRPWWPQHASPVSSSSSVSVPELSGSRSRSPRAIRQRDRSCSSSRRSARARPIWWRSLPASGSTTSSVHSVGRAISSPGTAVCVAGGVGAAVMFPIARRLAGLGVDVITVLGARTAESVLFEEEFACFAELVVCTDDGSAGRPAWSPMPPRSSRDTVGRCRLRGRTGADDARRRGGHPTARSADDRVAQPDHG